MDAFTPVLYGSKLNAGRKPAPAASGKYAPVALRGVAPGKAVPPPRYNLANLISERTALQAQLSSVMSSRDRGGVPAGARVLEGQLRTLDEQINATQAPAARPVAAPRPKPGAAAPVAPAAPAPAPVAAPAPIATPSPVETQATALKLAAEEQARLVEKAQRDELDRQDEIRRRRGTGAMAWVTGSLRGLPTNLAQLLGI